MTTCEKQYSINGVQSTLFDQRRHFNRYPVHGVNPHGVAIHALYLQSSSTDSLQTTVIILLSLPLQLLISWSMRSSVFPVSQLQPACGAPFGELRSGLRRWTRGTEDVHSGIGHRARVCFHHPHTGPRIGGGPDETAYCSSHIVHHRRQQCHTQETHTCQTAALFQRTCPSGD
jgi:hypothetical protein